MLYNIGVTWCVNHSAQYCSILFSDGKPPGVLDKLWIGLTAGAIGSIVGTPAEIALIRMTADGR